MPKGRTERRMTTNTVAILEAADQPLFQDVVVFSDISEHGARVVSSRHWRTGRQVVVTDFVAAFRIQAEIVYCVPQAENHVAVGLKFHGHPGFV